MVKVMKKAKFDGDYMILDLESFEELADLPIWRKRVMVEKRPDYGQIPRIFYPLYGRKAGLTALQDRAEVHNYRYKPYVDIDWLIKFESDENELSTVSFLLQVRDYLCEIAELEKEFNKDII